MQKLLQVLLLLAFVLNLSTHTAYAYLDPGTGSYLLQLLIGGLFGGLFVIKTFWSSLKNWFLKLLPKSKSHGDTKSKPTQSI